MRTMLERLLPLVIAVVVGTAPVAREICEISCSEPPTSSAAAVHAQGHSHGMADHEMTERSMDVSETGELPAMADPSTSSPSNYAGLPWVVSDGPQACGLDHESQAESAPPIPLPLNTSAIPAHVPDLVLPKLEATPFADRIDRSQTSIPIALRTPLRV